MTLKLAKKINLPDWILDPATQKVMQALDAGQGSALFVGGCVRNQLLSKRVEDIDIATIYKPDEVLEKLKQANIKAIPTGIEHGTVTAVVDGQSFEITTLRTDVETDGRHAKVGFTDDWVEDAKRRDFTINTLLADVDGNIYDPLGQGIEDLQAKHIRFVGDPVKRIEEDYLRILRFFRFHAFYGEGEMDEEALRACQMASAQIQTLSRERITSEFLKILGSDRAPQVLKIMFDHNVLDRLFKNSFKGQSLSRLIDLQTDSNVMARLYVMNCYQPKFHEDVLRLTHKQKNFMVKLVMATQPKIFKNEKSLKKAIYHHGNDLMLQGYLVWLSKEGGDIDEALLDILQNWQAPECPITGEQLIGEGYVTGPDLGLELERRKEEWLESVI
jgi:poly(A) polymerase